MYAVRIVAERLHIWIQIRLVGSRDNFRQVQQQWQVYQKNKGIVAVVDDS